MDESGGKHHNPTQPMSHNNTDDETVEIPVETALVSLRELNILIRETEDEQPDPLTDDVFRAQRSLAQTLEQAGEPQEI